MSGAITDDFNTFGMVVIQRRGTGDNLNSTANNVRVGYCDGEGVLQVVADNITF